MDIQSKKYQCNLKVLIKQKASELGFAACGMAEAKPVNDVAIAQYENWLKKGHHDCMAYAERYCDVRSNPCLLMPGAKTVISLAMNYYQPVQQAADAPQFACYAYGDDYHEVLRSKLTQLAEYIATLANAQCRVCVDTAPIREKYWAQQAGVGFVGRNNLLIVPGVGSYCFLGEVVTDLELEPDAPLNISCGACTKCVDACPGGALHRDGAAADAGRCLSCQLIERRGNLPEWVDTVKGCKVYGCDDCQRCCPHNINVKPTSVAEFSPREEILNLTIDDVAVMNQAQFSKTFAHSAIKRIKLEGLKRNFGIKEK